MLTKDDKALLDSKNISEDKLSSQIERFKKGFPFLNIVAPATDSKGIKRFDTLETQAIGKYYDDEVSKKSIVKFVPASGAASRMFKMLFQSLELLQKGETEKAFAKKDFYSLSTFAEQLPKFAFYNDLASALRDAGYNIKDLMANNQYDIIIDYLLNEKGLNYGSLPKGLLKFHQYNAISRTPVEEHLVEAALYASNKNKEANIHFTISPEHKESFKKLLERELAIYEAKFKVKYKIDYSEQKKSTDTVAVNTDNTVFRNENGEILFRPAGHGALIENLNEIDADVVFVKNIDNVAPDHLKADTIKYKKLLGGVLLKYQEKIFNFLAKLDDQKDSPKESLIAEVAEFVENDLCCKLPDSFNEQNSKEQADILNSVLDRPIRVCGMVRNEGEPGGGPFLVQHSNGQTDLQIVEKAQIDENNQQMAELLSKSTHFNPVDLVCSAKRYVGNQFDLTEFVDPDAGIITSKTMNGKDLKALELPGLWNGAMARWNTIFVEVPLTTFSPVKEVNDLLRPVHQQNVSEKVKVS